MAKRELSFEYNGKRYNSEDEVDTAILDKFPATLDDDGPEVLDREWASVVVYQECDDCNGTGNGIHYICNVPHYYCQACGGNGEIEINY